MVDQITSTQSAVENILTVVCAKKTVLQGFPVNMNNLAQDRLTGLSNSANNFFTAAGTALANVRPFALHLRAKADHKISFTRSQRRPTWYCPQRLRGGIRSGRCLFQQLMTNGFLMIHTDSLN